jgi:glycosyltransferase involved in cell wall biosynthesis
MKTTNPHIIGDERIKVLHIIQGKHFGGAEQVILTLVKSWDQRHVSPYVCCLDNGLLEKKLHNAGIPCFVIQMGSRFDLAIPLVKMLKLIHAEKFDIIHTHSVRSNLIGRIAALISKTKCITHLHSPVERDFADPKRGSINETIDSITRPIASKYIAVSKSLKSEMIEKGMHISKIKTIYNAVDISSFRGTPRYGNTNGNIRKEFSIPNNGFLIALIALIRPRKGVEVLIKAAKPVLKRCPHTYFLIVGSDDISENPAYGKDLRKLAETLGISSRIIFTGFRNDIATILNRCDLLVLPSLFGEGLPMVVLEAMACGVPVIATNIEGVPEIIEDGINGFIVEPGDMHGR